MNIIQTKLDIFRMTLFHRIGNFTYCKSRDMNRHMILFSNIFPKGFHFYMHGLCVIYYLDDAIIGCVNDNIKFI